VFPLPFIGFLKFSFYFQGFFKHVFKTALYFGKMSRFGTLGSERICRFSGASCGRLGDVRDAVAKASAAYMEDKGENCR
jgi:hypothetical protein